MNALAGLSKTTSQPRYGGALAAKLVDQLNKSGIIDSEYINEVNSFFNPTTEPQTTTPQPSSGAINWEEYIKTAQ
jgi:dUTPase